MQWTYWFKSSLLVLVAIIALVLWFRSFDPAIAIGYLQSAHVIWILAFLATKVVIVSLRAVRWHSIISSGQPLSLRTVGEIYFVGEFVNATFAMRSGDVLKAALVRQAGGPPVASGLALVFADKMLELWGLVSIIAFSILLSWDAGGGFDRFGLSELLACTVLLICTVIMLRLLLTGAAGSLVAGLRERQGIVGSIGTTLNNGMLGVRAAWEMAPRKVAVLMGLSSLIFLVDAASVVFLFWAVGVQVLAAKALLAACMVAFVFVLPSPPGYIGTLEAGFMLFYGRLGVATNEAIAAVAILFHGTYYVAMLVVALSGFGRYRGWLQRRPAIIP